jgi:hypothetical protein
LTQVPRASGPAGKAGLPAVARHASLYLLLGTLLLGMLWSGAYFPTPKEIFSYLLIAAGSLEMVMAVAFGRAAILKAPALWMLAAVAALAVASLWWAQSAPASNREAVLMIGYLAAYFVARSQLVQFGGKVSGMILNWLVYAAGFASAWGMVTYLVRIDPYVTLVDGFLRAGSTFEYSNALSCFALMALPVTVALHHLGKAQERPLFATAASLQVAAVVLTFSRLGVVLLGVMAVYFLIVAGRRRLLPETALMLVAGLLMAAVAMVLGEAEYGKTGVTAVVMIAGLSYLGQGYSGTQRGRRLMNRVSIALVAGGVAAAVGLIALSDRVQLLINVRFREGFAVSRLLPHREDTWTAAWHAFQDRPVKGWGFGSFTEIFPMYQTAHFTKFAHNLVLQMAVDTGIIGGGLFLLFLLYILFLCGWLFWGRYDLASRALAIAALIFIIYNMFDWEWYIPAITAWFMVVVACLEKQVRLKSKGTASPDQQVQG